MTVPRGTVHPKGWEPRLSVRVSRTQKAAVRDAVAALQRRGLRTSESELVELLVDEGVKGDLDELEQRLRSRRAEKERT